MEINIIDGKKVCVVRCRPNFELPAHLDKKHIYVRTQARSDLLEGEELARFI